MPRESSLMLYEEVTLLAFREEEGTVRAGVMYAQAVGGALLAELLLRGRIAVDAGRRKIVSVVDDTPVGDALIDECLDRIRTAKRRASAQAWVTRFANMRRLKHRVASQLVDRGVLRADERSLLLVFSRTVYPELTPGPERRLVERLRRAIVTEDRRLDPRTVVLISLALGTGLLRAVFGKKELRGRDARIQRIVKGELVGQAAKEAVAAAHAAVMVAVIIPAVASHH
jgi:hypothetical protein